MLVLTSSCLAAETWTQQTSTVNDYLYGISIIDPATAVAVGNNGAIIKTTDYGSNWATKLTGVATNDLRAVDFPSASVGYAVGVNTSNNWGLVYKTTDGGENWTNISNATINSNSLSINDVVFFTETTGIICGNHSASGALVFKTTDGGSTWDNANSGLPVMIEFNALHFNDANNGWVVGAAGNIHQTTDGGSSWSQQTSGTTYALNDVFFYDSDDGWAVGNGSATNLTLLYTTNGGSNWSNAAPSGADNLQGTRFIDSNTGWVVSQNGVLMKTTDGGSNWTTVLDDSGVYYDIDFANSYNAWIIGGYATQNPSQDHALIRKGIFDPTITSITPSTANQGDVNLAVTLEGTNFLTGLTTTSVTFSLSGITVNSLTRDSDSQITLLISVSTSGATGIGDLTLTNPDAGSVTESNAFSVNPFGVTPPVVTSASPETVGQNADTTVVITGSNFHPASTPEVLFSESGVTVNSISSVTATAITCNVTISAAASPTWRTITVTNTDDSGVGSKSNAFKVTNAPSILTIVGRPRAAAAGYTGTTNATYYVTGNYFQTGAAASFTPADITVNSVSVSDSQSLVLDLTIPTSATPSAHSLTITNPDLGNSTLANALTISQQSTSATVDQTKSLAGPNPWNPLTGPVTLQFFLTKDTQIKLTFFTINGEKLTETTLSGVAGYNKVTWNGDTISGHKVPNGIFLVNIVDLTRGTTIGNIKVMVQRYLP